MRDPGAVLAFHAGLKTFAAKFLNQRRREERRDNRKPLVRPKRIYYFPDFRKWLDAFGENRTNIERFEFACHIDYSSQRFRRSPANVTSAADQNVAITLNQSPACAIHQFASGVLFAASAGICSSAKSA